MRRYLLTLPAAALLAACSIDTPTAPVSRPRFDNAPSTPSLSLDATADPTVIDFESLEALGGSFTPVATYSENGFTIVDPDNSSSYAFLAPEVWSPAYQGSAALANATEGDSTLLTKDDGGAFNLVSIDIAEINPSDLTPREVPFTGTRADGSKVSVTFTTDGQAGFQTFTFDGFTDLTSLSWVQVAPGHQFDNITLTAASADPPVSPLTKEDCWNGKWGPAGFKNQGQCIRFVETGVDTR